MSEEKKVPTPAYLWFDAEFTDLSAERAELLQAALIITDRRLNRLLPRGLDVNEIVRLPPGAVVSAWVSEHLGGLVEQARTGRAIPVADLDALLVERVVRAIGPVPSAIKERPVLAGNSIHADRKIIEKCLPRFAQCLHYRMLDVSCFKIAWSDYFEQPEFDKDQPALIQSEGLDPEESLAGAKHDACYDVQASIAEYRYYLRRMCIQPPA